MQTLSVDAYIDRLNAGERLSAGEIQELAASPDILILGMLADVVRGRLHGTRATFLRVAEWAADGTADQSVPAQAQELRITGSPADVSAAVRAVQLAKAAAGERTVSGFTWADVERLAGEGKVDDVLNRVRDAGLDALAELPLDAMNDGAVAIDRLAATGFGRLRLTIDKSSAEKRTSLLLQAADLQGKFGCIQAISPLPMTLATFRPTTGYEDVKVVAIARLAAPNIPTVQVDWRRYGPKLAQVALTFGADDIDGISPSDDAPEGRRRAPLEEIRRNIEAAGFQPVERDGRFAVLV
jgi:aminodeoxyfutalosine synthase